MGERLLEGVFNSEVIRVEPQAFAQLSNALGFRKVRVGRNGLLKWTTPRLEFTKSVEGLAKRVLGLSGIRPQPDSLAQLRDRFRTPAFLAPLCVLVPCLGTESATGRTLKQGFPERGIRHRRVWIPLFRWLVAFQAVIFNRALNLSSMSTERTDGS